MNHLCMVNLNQRQNLTSRENALINLHSLEYSAIVAENMCKFSLLNTLLRPLTLLIRD